MAKPTLLLTLLLGAFSVAAAADESATRQVKAGSLPLTVPVAWKQGKPSSRFRLAQFEVPPVKGDSAAADLVVYYFGTGGAGGVDANIRRWIGQFEESGRTVAIFKGAAPAGKYALVDVTGTYNKPIGPPIRGQTQRLPGARMLAAVLSTDEGPCFLKFAGPKATVSAAAAAFRASFGADPKKETKETSTSESGKPSPDAKGEKSGTTRSVKAGTLSLDVPATWKQGEPSSRFRLAQFTIPAAKKGEEGAELVVFYFGAGGAGGVQANIERWINQFDPKGRTVKLASGVASKREYSLLDVTGTYNKPIGPPIRRQSKPTPGSRMLAAILETDAGPYFLKLTGPEALVASVGDEFRAAFGANRTKESAKKVE